MTVDRNSELKSTELLVDADRFDPAIAEFQRFAHEQADTWTTVAMLVDLLLSAGETAAAEARPSEALAYLSVVANWRVARRDQTGATELQARMDGLELEEIEAQLELARSGTSIGCAVEQFPPTASKVRPAHAPDVKVRAMHARACMAQGDAVGAAEHLMAEMADGDPSLLLTIAEIQLRGGKLDRGVAVAEKVITDDPSFAGAVARLGVELAARQPDAGFLLVDMAVNVWIPQSQWRAAADAFGEFVARAPDCAPALVRLQEISTAASHTADEKRVILPFRPLLSAEAQSRTAISTASG